MFFFSVFIFEKNFKPAKYVDTFILIRQRGGAPRGWPEEENSLLIAVSRLKANGLITLYSPVVV